MQKSLRITSPHNWLLQNYSISAQQISHKVEWPKALEAIVIFIVPTSGKGQRIKDGIWQVEMNPDLNLPLRHAAHKHICGYKAWIQAPIYRERIESGDGQDCIATELTRERGKCQQNLHF